MKPIGEYIVCGAPRILRSPLPRRGACFGCPLVGCLHTAARPPFLASPSPSRREEREGDGMLTRSPRVPVQWPSEMSLGDSSSVDGGACCASLPTTFGVYAAAEQGHLSLMESYLAGGGNVNKRSKVRACRFTLERCCFRVCACPPPFG